MHSINQAMGEVTRALLALALVFLSFAPQPIAAEPGFGLTTPAAVSAVKAAALFCGAAPDRGDHGACHACRLGGAATVPVPPVAALPAFAALCGTAYAPGRGVAAAELRAFDAPPRAPPFA